MVRRSEGDAPTDPDVEVTHILQRAHQRFAIQAGAGPLQRSGQHPGVDEPLESDIVRCVGREVLCDHSPVLAHAGKVAVRARHHLSDDHVPVALLVDLLLLGQLARERLGAHEGHRVEPREEAAIVADLHRLGQWRVRSDQHHRLRALALHDVRRRLDVHGAAYEAFARYGAHRAARERKLHAGQNCLAEGVLLVEHADPLQLQPIDEQRDRRLRLRIVRVAHVKHPRRARIAQRLGPREHPQHRDSSPVEQR